MRTDAALEHLDGCKTLVEDLGLKIWRRRFISRNHFGNMVQRSAPGAEQNFGSAVTEVFPSFAAARAACGTGCDDTDIADVIAYKTSLAFDRRQIAPEQALNSIIALGICAAETHCQRAPNCYC
jgi:hypothetical protein